MMKTAFFFCCVCLLICTTIASSSSRSPYSHLMCRDPSFGFGNNQLDDRKFMVLAGKGNGIGNYLLFYPGVYFFAALTGRDIIILDDSLVAEMCRLIHCGFPLYDTVLEAYPHILQNITHELSLPKNANRRKNHFNLPFYRKLKPFDFAKHLRNESLIEDTVVYTDGYFQISGWYKNHPYAEYCISQLTGCKVGDTSCEDRHAYQQLIRGPFQRRIEDAQFLGKYLVGVPQSLKHAMLSLPHAMAPRLDFALHLRCQFHHFEYLVGPEDSLWPQHQKEISDFLLSEEYNAGEQLFREFAQKLQEEICHMLHRRYRYTVSVINNNISTYDMKQWVKNNIHMHRHLRSQPLVEKTVTSPSNMNNNYNRNTNIINNNSMGIVQDIVLYFAADNDNVKEALVDYLEHFFTEKVFVITKHSNDDTNHNNNTDNKNNNVKVKLHFMRMRLPYIPHAKDISHLKNETAGLFSLIFDWYMLSLANVFVSWRRDSYLPSTYASSARRFSGHSLLYNSNNMLVNNVNDKNSHNVGTFFFRSPVDNEPIDRDGNTNMDEINHDRDSFPKYTGRGIQLFMPFNRSNKKNNDNKNSSDNTDYNEPATVKKMQWRNF